MSSPFQSFNESAILNTTESIVLNTTEATKLQSLFDQFILSPKDAYLVTLTYLDSNPHILITLAIITCILLFFISMKQTNASSSHSYHSLPLINETELEKAKDCIKVYRSMNSSEESINQKHFTMGISKGGVSISCGSNLRHFSHTRSIPSENDLLNSVLMAVGCPMDNQDIIKPKLVLVLETRVCSKKVILKAGVMLRVYGIKIECMEETLETHQNTVLFIHF